MRNHLRLFHTIRHLRPRQIFFQVFYRLTGRMTRNGAGARVRGELEEATPITLPAPVRTLSLNESYIPPAQFVFLNRECTFANIGAIDWNFPDYGKLWTYNLNYFDFLRQKSITQTDAQTLIDAWVANEASHKDGWEPYPMSLRLVNWLQFYREWGEDIPPHVVNSIARQYESLGSKLEYHLDGNHLLENTITLTLVSGFLFDERMQRAMTRQLFTLIREQYDHHGGHFEGSVMYHAILLGRLLDLFSWLPRIDLEEKISRQMFREILGLQLGWLEYMTDANGNFPEFNDATQGIAPHKMELSKYADTLGIRPRPTKPSGLGYRRFELGNMILWADVAPIGPDYIPGHAHADNLTFVLHVNATPILVDPGISTYEKNARREWERSTAAHNTVTVQDTNSSDTWGGFRVGQRANTTILVEEPDRIVASHDGYRARGITHERTFHRRPNAFELTDRLQGTDETGTARFYFDHICKPQLSTSGVEVAELRLEFSGMKKIRLTSYQQAVGFNKLRTATVCEVEFSGRLTTIITPPK